MRTISSKPRKIPFKSAIAFSFVMLAWMSAAACSSASSSEFPTDASASSDAALQTCTDPITIGNGNDQTNIYPGGACEASAKGVSCDYEPAPTCGFDGTVWTCTCDGANWSCSITGGGLSGDVCGDEDASEATADPSDSGDGSNDASDDAADD